MGAWGERPNENDGAQDLLSEYAWRPLNEGLERLMKKRFKGDDTYAMWERIGVIYEVAMLHGGTGRNQVHADIDSDYIKEALGLLHWVERDEEWIATWRDPKKIRASIRQTRTFFEKWLNVHG